MTKPQVYLGNRNLKAANVNINYTPEQAKEWTKCNNDPIYFVKKYIKIISLDEGLIPFELWPFQEKMINTFHNNRFTICKMPRQSGKCVGKDTNIRIRNKKTKEIQEITIGDFYKGIGENELTEKNI